MKILVCMDSSIYADEILNAISRRAWLEDTQFQLITVLDTSGVADSDNQVLHQAGNILADRVRLLQKRLEKGTLVKGEVLEGSPAVTINQAAHEWGAELIMIGSH